MRSGERYLSGGLPKGDTSEMHGSIPSTPIALIIGERGTSRCETYHSDLICPL
jgi:hypothetical protein